MQYDLKDIAERIARIRGLEEELYKTLQHGGPTYDAGVIRRKLTVMHLALTSLADLLPRVE